MNRPQVTVTDRTLWARPSLTDLAACRATKQGLHLAVASGTTTPSAAARRLLEAFKRN